MGKEDEAFERLLVDFTKRRRKRMRSLEAHLNETKRILESEMDVQHTPISARLKDEDSALKTLRRRQEERKQLQELENLEWNMENKVAEASPFKSVDQMFGATHDLAGIRISVYFPDDVQKVVAFLLRRFGVRWPSQKGGLTDEFQKIRELRRITTGSAFESPFGGYKATHVVIKNPPDFDEHARGDPIIPIEVQIGSVIMHAWSDIEHDILYKPSDMGETSPDVVRMLNLMNGIVITGEVALQQLASVVATQTTRRAEDRTKKALGWEYMTPWLDKYFIDLKIDLPPGNQWRSTYCLFVILRATNQHTDGRLEELLEEMKPGSQEKLPVMILQHLGQDTYPFQDRPFAGKQNHGRSHSEREILGHVSC
ncbi:hypothetical protein M406DRAFT_66180 [Cryphonectria parasitica EP155]|uniref:RelA/SpoT domain-containing protein n=1 Tax=Cryphonectria parasitica (strain ATCC 38755 / EP155) TaxID=660469 RepID=A0A9P4YAA2_CRYP1|nr:uncharacterized protein M406DRAFT_66180 [Cryphonectria parasitica EP155]KAF3769708.1 hypothetical protein M406DRAFT_66180 [Cryphonectria parasitica EP155]